MRKYLAIAAAGGALAIGVPAAFAATGTPESNTSNVPVQNATPTPGSQQPDQQRPDRDDCPEKNGGGSGGNSSSSSAEI